MKTRRATLACTLMILLPLLSGCGRIYGVIDKLKARDHLNKGVAAYTAQRYDEAVEEFKAAIQMDPELTPAYLYLATAYRAQWIPGLPSPENVRRAEQAIKTFEQVLENDPDNINAMANIAGIYAGLDEHEKAKEWYRRRQEAQPTNPEPYYGVATINWKLVHDATGLNGENAPNLEDERRAEVQQLVDEGVQELQKALELNPNYSEALQYLNLLYRERAYLATDEEDKLKWQKEADKLALQALELKRKQAEEEERRRHTFGGAATEEKQ